MITILEPNRFIKHNNTIGININDTNDYILFSDGYNENRVIENNNLINPNIEDIEKALHKSMHLLEVAKYYNIVAYEDKDYNDYINYYKSYD